MGKTISSKEAGEIISVIFDFSNIVTAISSVVSVTCAVHSGTDASPSAMVTALPSITGLTVVQLVTGGYNGNSYDLKATIISGSERFSLTALLPIAGQ